MTSVSSIHQPKKISFIFKGTHNSVPDCMHATYIEQRSRLADNMPRRYLSVSTRRHTNDENVAGHYLHTLPSRVPNFKKRQIREFKEVSGNWESAAVAMNLSMFRLTSYDLPACPFKLAGTNHKHNHHSPSDKNDDSISDTEYLTWKACCIV